MNLGNRPHKQPSHNWAIDLKHTKFMWATKEAQNLKKKSQTSFQNFLSSSPSLQDYG